MAAGQNWTWEETLKAFALYFVLPSGKHDKGNPEVIALANSIGRTPSAVALKLANIKANDPNRSGVGYSHGSKLDARVWEEFAVQGDAFMDAALEGLAESLSHGSASDYGYAQVLFDLPEGRERQTVTSQRVNQQYFRNLLLENYHGRCCMTGISVEPLLVASHIKPWRVADPKTERLTPDNGILLNALHDKAFDKGLITINKDLRVVVSRKVSKKGPEGEFLWRFDGQSIERPELYPPRREFIEYHNDVVFLR